MAEQTDRIYDVRTLERFLDRGTITQEEYDAFLQKLPDVADKGATIEAEFVEGVLDTEDE